MPNKIKHLEGQRIGHWTVARCVGKVKTTTWTALWECRCDCGTVRLLSRLHLSKKDRTSCGCSISDKMAARFNREASRLFDNEIEWNEGFNEQMYRDIYAAQDMAFKMREQKLAEGGEMKLKYCSRCGRILPLEMFGSDRKRRDGRTYWCKDCCREWNKEQRRKAKETALALTHAPRRSAIVGSGRPLPCPEKYANEHADDWMFGDNLFKYKHIFI
jgi:hypothetical protein